MKAYLFVTATLAVTGLEKDIDEAIRESGIINRLYG